MIKILMPKIKNQIFLKLTKTSSPTGNSGPKRLPAIGDSFDFVETGQNTSGTERVYCSSERTDNVQIILNSFFVTDFQF